MNGDSGRMIKIRMTAGSLFLRQGDANKMKKIQKKQNET